ncbi:MAG: hypothetical protein ACTHU0_33605 [Kofleriaceae bacterium]
MPAPNASISALLASARAFGLERMAGLDASPENLEDLARSIYHCVLLQVFAGAWAEHGVRRRPQMVGLRVEVVLGNQLLGEPPLKIEFDFSKTALPLLVVETLDPRAQE